MQCAAIFFPILFICLLLLGHRILALSRGKGNPLLLIPKRFSPRVGLLGVRYTIDGQSFLAHGASEFGINGAFANPRYLRHCIRTATPTFGVFLASRQKALHEVFKGRGLTHEVETGDAEFDSEIFFACDERTEASRLLADQAVRDSLRTAFDCGVRHIKHTGGHLIATLRMGASVDDIVTISRCMRAISQKLSQLPMRELGFLRRIIVYPHLQIMALSLVLLFLGWTLVLFGARTFPPLDSYSIWEYGLWCAAPLMLSFTILSAFALAGSSHFAHSMLFAMVTGLLSSIGIGVAVVYLVNGGLDKSEAVLHSQTIHSKREGRTSEDRPLYFVQFQLRGEDAPRDLEISKQKFSEVVAGRSHLLLAIKPGYLGIPWIESRRVTP